MTNMDNFVIWIQILGYGFHCSCSCSCDKDIAEVVETRFKIDRPLPKRKSKNVVGLTKDELSEKIMKKILD